MYRIPERDRGKNISNRAKDALSIRMYRYLGRSK